MPVPKPKNERDDDPGSDSSSDGEQGGGSRSVQTRISAAHDKLLVNAQNDGFGWIPRILHTSANATAEDLAEKAKFEREYKDKLRGGLEDNTVVHALVKLVVSNRRVDVECFRPLLQLVLQLDPEILDVQNEDDKFAFFEAVRRHKSALVKLLCEIAPSPESLIGQKQGKNNTIHQAIKRNRSSFQPTIKILIENGKEEILKDRDEDDNTPLHLAVNHNYFMDPQNQLVQDLVTKCSAALDCENDKKLTPFLYLQRCREDFRESKKPKPAQKKEGIKIDDGKKGNEGGRDQKKTADPKKSANLERRDTGSVLNPRENTSKYESNTKAPREPERGQAQDSKNGKKPGLSDDQILSAFNNIESFLKKFILQRFPLIDASRLLYGPTSGDRNIDFNLLFDADDPPRLSPQMIKKNYKFLKFESTLQLVGLPTLLPEPAKPAAGTVIDPEREWEKPKPAPYQEIFDWLRDKGKVKEVLHIVVEDDLVQPHDDQTIEATLKDLGVEVWDWRKYDISSETIWSAAPHVKEVSLYTTGNNAVLRGWSDEGGLRKLRNLEKVKLTVRGLETSDRLKENVEKFKTRLTTLVMLDRAKHLMIDANDLKGLMDRPEFAGKSAYNIDLDEFIREARQLPARDVCEQPPKPLVITVQYADVSPKSETGQKARTMTSVQARAHRWLSSVDRCAEWVRNMDGLRPVKVALIDDGVDANHDYLRENIKRGITFCTSHPRKERVTSSYYASTSGHGTLMGTLIRTVCPAVELYIAKLDNVRAAEGYGFTAQSAAEAVEWAVQMDVDIISMSWTIEKNEKDEKKTAALRRLDRAVREAADKNILMFCAARDEGLEQPKAVPYPAASDTQKIFVVGAATPSGAASTWVNERAVHFLFPGTELRESRPQLMPPEMLFVDGSSPATALASGLAGLLLNILATDTSKKWDSKKAPERYEKMSYILSNMKGEGSYVQVWDLFDRYMLRLKSENNDLVRQEMVERILMYSEKER